MTKRKLKPFVVPMMYTISVIMFVFSMYFIQKYVGTTGFEGDTTGGTEYVDQDITNREDQVPVVNTDILISKPYLDETVTIGKDYYDYQADVESQEKAIIYYGDTYMQNSGVDYIAKEKFDVVSILEGTVTSVKEDDILGNIVEVRHDNDIISVYQSLSEVSVKENDKLLQGQVIGKSGTSNINSDLGNHLHFELYYQGKVVNPEDYYNKNLKDL